MTYRERLLALAEREYVRDEKGQFAETGASGASGPHPYLRPGETEGDTSGRSGMQAAGPHDTFPTPETVKDWGHPPGVLHASGDETSASADKAPELGKPFIVYRLGRPDGGLTGRNAGNAEGVADHIMRVQDPDTPANVTGAGSHVTAYRVTVTEPFTEYVSAVGGRGGRGGYGAHSGDVGREATPYQPNAQYGVPEGRGQVRYSFPAGGNWTATPIGTRSLAEIETHLGSSMDYAGGLKSADAIREVFTTKKLRVPYRDLLRLREYVRDEHGQFAETGDSGPASAAGAHAERHLAVNRQLQALVPGTVTIRVPTENLVTAAEAVNKVLTEMKADGLEMPHNVTIDHVDTGGISAQVQGITIEEVGKGGKTSTQKNLMVAIPATLPQGANLDDAVKAVFDKPSLVSPKHAYHDTEYDHYDRFAARSLKDVIVHEMGHVQAGHRGEIPYADLLQRGTFRNMDAIHQAAMRVSEYAHTSADEFLGEAYLRRYRGETLAEDSQKLYTALNGPLLGWSREFGAK